jgi:predicted RecA/RadA family phage recombinase
MATTARQESAIYLQVVAAATHTAGTPIQIGNLFGVPQVTVASGSPSNLQIGGVAALPKTSGAAAYLVGQKVLFDSNTNVVVDTGDFPAIGTCAKVATAAATSVDVWLNELPKNISGTVTLASGGSTGTATVPAGLAGKNVLIALKAAAGAIAAAVPAFRASISGTTLTVTSVDKDNVATNVSSNVTVTYLILA